MRRILAIGLAVLIVALGTRAVMAGDDEQTASDRLLEILKQRQIISEDEYSELRGLASKMEAEDAEVNRRLGDLDRSISDYLAKDDEELNRAHVSYNKGQGFRFSTADGLFELNIGGFFLFNYTGLNMDRKRDLEEQYYYGKSQLVSEPASEEQFLYGGLDPARYRWGNDTNNFQVQENRFHFFGHAFSKDITYFIEFDGAPASTANQTPFTSRQPTDNVEAFYAYSTPRSQSGVNLLEAWVNYNVCDWFNVKFGQFKPPTDREFLVHESDLTFPTRTVVSDLFSLQRDVGIMAWDMREFKWGDYTSAVDYSFGVFNGEGMGAKMNDSNDMAYSMRTTFYPLGYVDYLESYIDCEQAPRFGVGGWYGHHKAHTYQPAFSTELIRDELSTWGLDGIVVYKGCYLTGEWIRRMNMTTRRRVSPTGHFESRNSGWFAQAGAMVVPKQVEVFGRYSVAHLVDPIFDQLAFPATVTWANEITEFGVGVAYYIDGRDCKITLDTGMGQVDFKKSSDEEYDYVRIAFWLNW
jgi:hypothetical protein